ncbi:hypothetical protein ACWGCW_23330 [Streptomyces sp. NPDC054933]
MPTDRLAHTVRGQLGIGRVLPLGEAADGSWITEQAAAGVLREAAAAVVGGRLGALRIALAGGESPGAAADVAAPPSALPPGPLRIEADFEATGDRPLPATADELRAALADSADADLGLVVTAIDLRVSGLLDDDRSRGEHVERADRGGQRAAGGAGEGAASVPGVARLTSRLGGVSPDVLAQIAVAAGWRALDVARAVRARVGVAVLVTDVE